MPVADKFQKTYYVTTYELARDGMANKQIAKALGVAQPTFDRWLGKDPALQDALARGRRGREHLDTYAFHDYVYDRLPPELRAVWDQLDECEQLKSGVERVEAIMAHTGIRARQHLFIYALTQSGFNISQSCKKLNIPRKAFDSWCSNDPDFAALVDELHVHKKDFFENAFINQVRQGNTLCILHGVRTQCRDRGYGDKLAVELSGSVQHSHTHTINILDLQLPVEVRQAILAAMRLHTQNQQKTLPAPEVA